MTRDQHLEFCSKCKNRKNNLSKGIVCSLTNEIADFEGNCSSYQFDAEAEQNTHAKPETIGQNTVLLTQNQMEALSQEQNLAKGILASSIVGLAGALLWGVITVSTGYQVGFLALGIGFIVGHTMRVFGKGIEEVFGISGALIALLSVLLGNVFSIIGFLANDLGMNLSDVITGIDFMVIPEVMIDSFEFMDLVFYAIAAYEGYKLSFRS
jgi:hypothetical protein